MEALCAHPGSTWKVTGRLSTGCPCALRTETISSVVSPRMRYGGGVVQREEIPRRRGPTNRGAHARLLQTTTSPRSRTTCHQWPPARGPPPRRLTVLRAHCRQVGTLSTDWQQARGSAGRVTAHPGLSLTVYERLPACSQTPQALARCLLSLGEGGGTSPQQETDESPTYAGHKMK